MVSVLLYGMGGISIYLDRVEAVGGHDIMHLHISLDRCTDSPGPTISIPLNEERSTVIWRARAHSLLDLLHLSWTSDLCIGLDNAFPSKAPQETNDCAHLAGYRLLYHAICR